MANSNFVQPTFKTLILSFVLCCATSVAWAQLAPANVDKAGTAKVITGDVRVVNAKGERALASGDAVYAQDRIIAGKQSAGSVVLRDGTTLVLSENSQVTVQNFAFNATTQEGNMLIDLLQGTLRVVTGLIAKLNPEAIQIKTKTVSVGVRGTDFIVEAGD